MKSFNKYLEDNILKKYDHLRTSDTVASFRVPKGMEKEMVKFFINSKLFPVIYLLPKTEEKSRTNINSVSFSLYPEDLSYHEQVEDLIVLALKQELTVNIFIHLKRKKK